MQSHTPKANSRRLGVVGSGDAAVLFSVVIFSSGTSSYLDNSRATVLLAAGAR